MSLVSRVLYGPRYDSRSFAAQQPRRTITKKGKVSHHRRVNISGASLPSGKVNAIRAAFKAGVRPSAIARQFGISKSSVMGALATEESKR